MRLLLLLFYTFLSTASYSQNGTIRGSVIEDATGEALVGVTVAIKGTVSGTITDLDGKFSLELPEGVYDLQISYVSFQTLTIEAVRVIPDEVTVLNDIRLKDNTIELEGVVVSAEAIRTTEEALITLKKRSPVMMDGISAAKIQMIGDATAVEAAKRITGVSIEGGKYIYVRGLGDRYSKSMLNNVEIPGLDPDRNSLQMDIFPTNLIDNMLVNKNFTADMPADFTGGLMNIETKDFPDEKTISISINTEFNPNMHFRKDFPGYQGGATDFLGYDDGTRALPEGADQSIIPTPISGASDQEVFDFVTSFNSQLGVNKQTSLLDYSASFSFGNQIGLGSKKAVNADMPSRESKLGYILSLTYKNEYRFFDDVTYGEYQRFIDPDIYEMRYATIQKGQLGERNILIGGLGGIAFKNNYSKIRLTAMRIQNGESRAGKFRIDNDGEAVGQSGYIASSDNLEYNQRSLTNFFLNGNHVFKNSGWEIDWRLSPTISTLDDPDIRKTAFTLTDVDTSFIAGAGGNPTRIWRSLKELNAVAKVDIIKKFTFRNSEAEIKFGVSHNYKERDYEILFFDIQFFGGQDWPVPEPDMVLNEEHIYPNRPNRIYYQSGNNDPNPNEYQSNINNTAFYFSSEVNFFPALKTIIGLRSENYIQRHTGRDQMYANGDEINGRNLNNEKVLESPDLFPSLNFIYSVTQNQNIRVSYSRTIARPSFKEVSFAQIIDPITNRIFNGSLFPYSDWEGNLTETRIDNYDLRWELFMGGGQIFSTSVFYKKFDNPIELVRIPEQQTSTEYQPRNVGDGSLYGIELEMNKNLDFISSALRHLTLSGNITFVESKIEMTEREFNSRKTYEKSGENVTDSRQMARQAPYMVNLGITYDNYETNWEAGIFYNVKGPAINIVGAGLFPDIYDEPFHSLIFSVNKKFGKNENTILSIKADNLLNDRIESFYRSFRASKQPFSSINPGRSFSVGLRFNL